MGFQRNVEATVDFTFKIFLYAGFLVLMIGYSNVYVRNKNLDQKYGWFKDVLHQSKIEIRNRRSVDNTEQKNMIKDIEGKIDSLQGRINKTDAFNKLVQTPFAALLPYLRGPMGKTGAKGKRGPKGNQGQQGRRGKAGPQGFKGEKYVHITNNTGSNTYVRWGRTECPNVHGTKMLYKGYAAGQHQTHSGGMSNTVCLHMEPTFGKYSTSADTLQWIYGVEYEVANAFTPLSKNLHNKDAPCAVCRVETRGSKLMIPGRNICPSGWVTEYKGYLMSEHYGHKGRTTAVCVDADAEAFPRSQPDKNGNLWYAIQAACGSLPCGPYVHGREITCAVCTK
eukprot:gene6019-6718_t